MRRLVSSATPGCPLRARLAVATETPAALATSRMPTGRWDASLLIGSPPARRSLARLRQDAHWLASGKTLIGSPPARRSLARLRQDAHWLASGKTLTGSPPARRS